MFEPITLTVAELAARWNRTPKQILEFAQHLGVPLYFNYGCLAFEETDSWHRSAGDQWEVQERDYLTKAVESREEQIIRARDGQLSQWEQLPAGGVPELRKEINTMKSKLRFIEELLERRDVERTQCELGFLRAGPGTLFDIGNDGEVKFPRWAFHSAGEITAHVVHDERGNQFLEWVGRKMILEARNDGDPRWRRLLLVGDLFASLAEVKAIEAKSESSSQPANSPAPAMEPATAFTVNQGIDKMKKAALVSKYKNSWPSVEADIGNASRTALKEAKLGMGYYDVTIALRWAKQAGKMSDSVSVGSPPSSILSSPTSIKHILD